MKGRRIMKKSLIAVPIGDPGRGRAGNCRKGSRFKRSGGCGRMHYRWRQDDRGNAIKITGADLRVHVINEPKEGDFREESSI